MLKQLLIGAGLLFMVGMGVSRLSGVTTAPIGVPSIVDPYALLKS